MIKEFDSQFKKMFDLEVFLSGSKSVICFSMDLEGNVLLCNEAYNRVLQYRVKNIKDKLVNPLLQDLVIVSKNGIIFNGIITLKKNELDSSFVTKIYKHSEQLFFLCEYDGFEMETLFKEISLNALSMNNMNRELIIKEIKLKNSILKQKETQNMLLQSEKMNALGQLAAGIAHEINNPMTYVIGNIQIMGEYFVLLKKFFKDCEKENILIVKKRYNIDSIVKNLSDIQQSTLEGSERVKTIVSEMSDYSRIDNSEKAITNIENCIKSSLIITSQEIKKHSIKLKLDFSKISNIKCYPARLEQVFLNMIINAIQATGDNGTVIIRLYEKGNNVIIEIEDNGIGIATENKNKIFEPFFTTKPKGIGLGLGLNLSYRIIRDMHNGDICFDSIAGKGTVFTISIPKGVN